MTYTVLDQAALPGYLEALPAVMDVLGPGEGYDITEIGDGNLNFVYRVARRGDRMRSVILKQAVPYLRVAGEDWPLSRNRMVYELRASRLYGEVVPDFVPSIYHADEEMSVVIMEDLRDLRVLRYPMIEGELFPRIGRDIGQFLGMSLFKLSYLGMDSMARRALMADFVSNDELCKLTEEFIFTFPFVTHESNYVNPETNAYATKVFRGDPEYLKRVLHFKELFLAKPDALLHGDLHTGSVMASPETTYVIDPEFAFFGPFGFDVGKIMANFLFCYTAHYHRSGGPDYQEWLLGEVATIWTTFETEFLRLWGEQGESAQMYHGFLEPADLEVYKAEFMHRIFQDAIGFAACSLARRTVGIAGNADVRGIEDMGVRTRLEKMNIDLSYLLMMKHDELDSIDALLAVVRDFHAARKDKVLEGLT